MRFLVKSERPSALSRLKDFFAGGSRFYETLPVDAPYRSTSRKSLAAAEWHPASVSADEALLSSLKSLRDQSRDLDRNEGIARGAIENFVTNVVADGLRPQARLDHTLLGIAEEKAREFERRAEKFFDLHMSKNTADFHAESTFAELQAEVLRATFLDGDCLVLRRHERRPGAILPTMVQLLDGGRLQNPFRPGGPNADIREGVEFDSSGKAIAYHIRKAERRGLLGDESIRVPRFDDEGVPVIIHIHHRRLPGQSRGEPFLAPVIQKFKQISRYSEAEIAAAVINAYFSMFITSESGNVFGNRGGAHLAKSGEPKAGADSPEALPERQAHRIGLTEGTMLELLPNEKVSAAAPGRPNSNYDPFVQAVIKQIGIGLGLPYEVLTQHFQSSYSAARAAILEGWKAFKVRRAWLVAKFCQPVWEWVIADAIAEGLIDAPGFEDPLKRQLYFCTQWTGTEMESIDPLKEAKANEVEIETGVKSRRYIVESQGRDFDKHLREWGEEADIFLKKSAADPRA